MDSYLNNFGLRLRRLIESRGTIEDAYRALGVSRATLFNWLKRDRPPPGEAMREKIRQYLGNDAAEILDLRPESASTLGHTAEGHTPHGPKPREITLGEVPVVSWARAGEAANYEEIPKDWQHTIYTTCRVANSFGIEVEGDSMSPDFRAGDIVVVMPEVEPRNHHPVVAKLRTDGVVLKNYTRNRDSTITLTSVNPAYAPLVYGPEEFHWIYPVHSTVRMNWK